MKIIVRPVFLAANFFLIVLALLHHTPVFQPALAPPTPDKPERLSQAEAAFRKKINIQAESVAAYLLYSTHLDDLALSNDGDWATAQLSPVDTQTNQVVPAEPGLAVAHLDGGSWQAFLPGDSGWVQAVKAAPDSLLSAQAKTYWLELDLQQSQSPAVGPYRGYLLPWAGGTTLFMTQSVHHDAYTPSGSAHYAFDFAAPWEPGANSSPMFNIYAAKAGTVKMFYDGWENGHYNPNNPNEVNYLVLEDMTTTPTTYQLYLHLAQDSIAPKLKQVGAPAQQGEFLAVADDTGVSSGNHLHFQVHTNPNSYYSTSVDITFDDVAINGGRPRNSQDLPYCHPDDVCNQTSDRYTSGNTIKGDVTPPTGDLLQPAATGASIHSSHLSLEGWAYDQGSGLKSAQFIANFGGAWHEIGDSFTNSPFSMDWDLCADQVPDGPVSVALRLKDNSGNLSLDLPGLRHLVKNYACAPPPPACSPGANQAALYADSSYGGACVLLDTGVYTSPVDFGLVGPKNTASILLGSNAQATLYMNSDLTGRGETFQADDSNLQDNLIGTDNVSSVKVHVRSDPPAVPTPLWPEAGASFSAGDSLSLVWGNAGASEQFRARLVVAGQTLTSSWRKEPFWHLGSLASGSYTWQVQSGNGGGESAWSSPRNLLVSPLPPASTTSYTAPYSDNMENGDNGWQNSSYWDQTNLQNHTSGGKASWVYDTNSAHGYDTGEPNSGDLTSPPIHIPDTGYYLRFWYRYETESQGTHWDQRWLQISADGGPFTNTLQLSDDPDNYWLHSPAVDLSVYSGKTIQTRFHFETLDAAFNDFQGWFIDDFDISQAAPPNCGDTNNSPAQATPVSYGSSVPALICPAGDKDYYRFTGKAGDQVGISVDATSTTSPLDPILFVLDSDQSSVLAENDDLVAFKLTNSFTSLRLPHDGVYTILVRAWNHPSRGDEKATYTLRLFSEKQLPTASIAFPPSGIFLPNNPFTITVNAADADSGVSHVVFSLHSSNWLSSDWTQIGEDWDGSDGWQLPYDPSQLAEQKDIAFFASVYDKAGNFSGAGAWSLAIDRTPPVSAIQPMSATQQSTAILVQWTGEDNISGIDHFDLQSQIDNGTWKDQLKNIPAVDRQAWVIAEAGHQYGFRMRAVDRLGNVENYPQAAEASTTVPADVCSGPDEWENDNQPASANTVSSNSAPQRHTYCNPEAGTNWLHDEDWLKVTAMTGETIWVASIPQSGAAASVLELYDSNLVTPTLLAETIPIDIGAATQLKWRLEQDGTYYLRLHNPDESVAGDGVIYKVWVRKGQLLYLPLIHTRP
jgi:murein DD-endopeptidase MepM/ murein hydrolase activator NlpD